MKNRDKLHSLSRDINTESRSNIFPSTLMPVFMGLLLLFLWPVESRALDFTCSEDETAALTPSPLGTSWALSWWIPRHEEKLAAPDREDTKLLFLGDSITQGWETDGSEIWESYYTDRNPFNLGFSGDRTENVLWRLQNGEVDGMNPSVVVLMIGTNNTGHRQDSPGCTTRGVEMILEELAERLPESKVLLTAVFPRGSTPEDPLRQLNSNINTNLATLADNERVFYMDIHDAFLDSEGVLSEEIMPDMLHPNERGYAIWAEEMEPALEWLLELD